MGKWLVVTAFLLVACQPMYSKTADGLKDPPKRPPPKQTIVETKVAYVEECQVDFRGPPAAKRRTAASQQLVIAGDTQASASARTDVEQVEHARNVIKQYREALIADPYNPEATLKLALAYDKVLRKGCAIAMLKRLASLAENPKFDADKAIGRVVDNEQWFRPYRNDALRAIGH